MQIEYLTANDFEEAMDFINMVFSMAHGPFNFPAFLPRLYRPTEASMSRNLVVRENGKIRALVGLYPDIMHIGGLTLKLGGIGAVSSHPNDRGMGWMKMLMDRQIQEMRQDGFDLSFLSGQRQRYQYFGYEKTGAMLEYKLNKSNMKHTKISKELPSIIFEPIQASDMQYIEKAKTLHDAQMVHCLRPLDDFYLFLITAYKQPWVALRKDGSFAGYLTANRKNNEIIEIFAEDETMFAGMVHSWFSQQNLHSLKITLPSWARGSAQYLGSVAEEMLLTNNCNWQIFNWQKVVDALLRAKSNQHSLSDGMLCVGIKGHGVIQICVNNGWVTCEATAKHPDVEWDSITAMRILFGHIPPSYVTAIPESVKPLISSWFPLPLSWLPTDHV